MIIVDSFGWAEISLRHSLPMADAIVYATGAKEKCSVVTSDPHFKNLENHLENHFFLTFLFFDV